jgi:hypothetical protein
VSFITAERGGGEVSILNVSWPLNWRNRMKSAALVFLLLGASFAAAQKLTVTAVSHTATDRGYNLYTPQTTDTNCTSGPTGFPTTNCTSTTTGGTSHVPIHVLTEVVVADGTQYTLSATSPLPTLRTGTRSPPRSKGTICSSPTTGGEIRARKKHSNSGSWTSDPPHRRVTKRKTESFVRLLIVAQP